MLISVHQVHKSYGDRAVLTGVSMSVSAGERVGIVGENGSGKSTLMRLLAGVERPDDGEVRVSGDLGYLGQTLGLPPTHTVQQAVDAALADLRAMERRMRELESALTEEVMHEYGELLTAYELRGGYEADARVDRAFHGLGLAHVGRDRPLSSLSGGEQARLGLVCVLAAAPRVLLLDEPTNHLDAPALTWLEDRVREHRGAVAVISHDRVFLDRVATAIVEVEHGSVTRFGGGYTGFLAAKAAARARWEQAYAAWCEEVRQAREYASTTAHRVAAGRVMRDNNKMAYDRNAGRVQSSVATRVRNAHERLRRLEADPVPRPPAPLRFHGTFAPAPPPAVRTAPAKASDNAFRTAPAKANDSTIRTAPAKVSESTGRDTAKRADEGRATRGPDGQAGPDAGARVLVELRDLHIGDRLHIDSLTIRQGERLLVRGANGAGKSTLLQALAAQAERTHRTRLAEQSGPAEEAGPAEQSGLTEEAGLPEESGLAAGTGLAERERLAEEAGLSGHADHQAERADWAGCRVGYLPQEVTFDPDQSVLEAYGEGYEDERRAKLLSTGLFRAHTLDQKVGTLSVGQQRRLALARLLARQYDLLLLDEPTNHLSPVLAEELERALDAYGGALVLVSHDRALVRRFRGAELELVGGRVR
ncbi:ATP-binding cassette domain-containing protein [[Actinomadura] parvosata]|uniref:ATP-binding cassette domain-containing protein n=1 Tax=[Actinomadura] parvosata TaxID=1955412 RepID=UPI00406C769E